ncbi:homocysteine S-methyltransferase family protein [Tautonia marina]|uniref:homocysteine S-methyltransferase family protein n=1 Tax=Tautonia marina TaxID=2653855 RepID=UPI001260D479|nr:homocysteine S-methyltransferase family protein [Tautonia marina]
MIGPLLLDAAMGTRLIARGLDLTRDDPSLWNLDHPEAVAAIHRLDVEAGADALTTNSFGANRAWLSRYGRAADVAAINRQAATLAREAAGPDRLVLGCIGPTAPGTEDEAEQARLLADAGVDALLLETNATAEPIGDRLRALHAVVGLPMIVTYALVADDDPLPELDVDPNEVGLQAIGWNCIPPERAVTLPDRLRRPVKLPLIFRPSGGGWMDEIPRLLDHGVRYFGGCCGTTEADVADLRRALGPRRSTEQSG